MKTLFIIPQLLSLFGDEFAITAHPHLGIAYLSSFLKKNGINVGIYDMNFDKKGLGLKEIVNKFKPDLVCFTAYSYGYNFFQNAVTYIRSLYNGPIVVGGPHASVMKEKIFSQADCNFVVVKEGEFALLNLIKQMQSERDFSNVENLIYRLSGSYYKSKKESYISDLDDLPYPDFFSFGIEKYPCYKSKRLPIITSRGCPYSCNFCSASVVVGRKFRQRTPKNVVNELEHWVSLGYTNFDFDDDVFNLDLKRAIDICEEIIRRKLNITYELYNGMRADRVTMELLIKMKQSGCKFLSYGLEAADEDVLNLIGKGISLEKVKKAIELTNKVGIKHSVNFIIGHSGENYKKAMKTISFAKSLKSSFINVSNLIPYPGTRLYGWIKQNGRFIYPEEYYLNKIGAQDYEPVFETNDFTKEERIKILKLGRNLCTKTIMVFRLGKVLGNLIYYITRIKIFMRIVTYIGLYNPLGKKLYNFLSKHSRE